jgi:membrane protease YdiL (CAAX protease family)
MPTDPLATDAVPAPVPVAAGGSARQRRLGHAPTVLGIAAVALALFAAGEVRSAHPYTDPRFVVDYVATELAVTAWLLLATALWLPARALGLRLPTRPTPDRPGTAWPVAGVGVVATLTWAVARLNLPADSTFDPAMSPLLLRTTLLVGLNEEWLFRGLLLAAACRWWGLRRGAAAALLGFGLFHLLNLLAGVPPALGAIQLVSTVVLGAIFLMGALATRSLLVPMAVHAVYDFAVMDINRMAAAGGSPWIAAVLPMVCYPLGLYCLWRLWRLPAGEPYPSDRPLP